MTSVIRLEVLELAGHWYHTAPVFLPRQEEAKEDGVGIKQFDSV